MVSLVFWGGLCEGLVHLPILDGAPSPYMYGKRHLNVGFNEGGGRLICHWCMQMVFPWSFFVGGLCSLSRKIKRERERTMQHTDVYVTSIPLGQVMHC